MSPRLILASASPRRAQILTGLGVAFRILPADIDETLLLGEAAAVAAERLARIKAEAVAAASDGASTLPVLAADTLVVSQGRALGKPASDEEAAAMLAELSGRTHEVVTGIALVHRGETFSAYDTTRVVLSISREEIQWYVGTGEPSDKAGAYNIHERGALFIDSVSGSPSNVAGLPVRLFLKLVRQAGVDLGLP